MSIQNVRQIQRFAVRRATVSPITVFTLQELGNYSEEHFRLLRDYCDRLHYDAYDPALKAESLIRAQELLTYKKHELDWSIAWNDLKGDTEDGLLGVRYWLERAQSNEIKAQLSSIKPYRKRASYKFLVSSKGPFEWSVHSIGSLPFSQNVADERVRPRVFMPIADDIVNHDYFQWLVAAVAQLTFQTAGIMSDRFYITAHFMQTHASSAGNSPAPEGIHQDGSNFIVSGLVLERENVNGGVSTVYYNNPNEPKFSSGLDKSKLIAIQRQLKIGEGIFQADVNNGYWHSVSDVSKQSNEAAAYRSILGFDIDTVFH